MTLPLHVWILARYLTDTELDAIIEESEEGAVPPNWVVEGIYTTKAGAEVNIPDDVDDGWFIAAIPLDAPRDEAVEIFPDFEWVNP